jgi:carboxyl-terminal processing protease
MGRVVCRPFSFILIAVMAIVVMPVMGQESQVELDDELKARIAAVTIDEVVADFDTATQVVSQAYVDGEFGGSDWEGLINEYRPRVGAANGPDVAYGILADLISQLGNPLTYVTPPWFRPRQIDDREQEEGAGIELEYAGVGVLLQQMTTGDVWVVQVFKETPAERSGVLLGDVITGVDGWTVPVEDAVPQIASRVRGPVGTDVTLTLRDPDSNERDVIVTRGHIDLRPSVEFRTVDGTVGYLRVPAFTQELVDEASKALPKLLQTRYLILDLRNVSGGDLEAMSRVAQWFLGAAQMGGFVAREGGFGLPFRDDAVAAYQRPVAVLINSGTYGIGEMLATILHDYKRARLVGNKTGGGFHLFQTVELPSGGALNMTIGLYVSPKSELLPVDGIEPDDPIELPDLATVRAGTDVYLEGAVEVLRNNPRL